MLHPLSAEILAKSFPDKFKFLSLDKYDEKTNPRSHLANFRMTMLLQNINDMVLCKVIPSTLTRLAQMWYQHLPVNSTHDFKELAYVFKQQFITYIPPKRLSSDLQKVRQAKEKSLRSYIDRFNTEAI